MRRRLLALLLLCSAVSFSDEPASPNTDAIELIQAKDEFHRKLGWLVVKATVDRPDKGGLTKEALAKLESLAVEQKSLHALNFLVEWYARDREKRLQLLVAPNALEASLLPTVLLAELRARAAKLPSITIQEITPIPEPTPELLSVIYRPLDIAEKELWQKDLTDAARPILRGISALRVSADSEFARELYGEDWELRLFEILLDCATAKSKEVAQELVSKACDQGSYALRSASLKLWTFSAIFESLKGSFKEASLKGTGLEHLQMSSEVLPGGVLKANGSEVNFKKASPLPGKDGVFVYDGSSVELGRQCFYTYRHRVIDNKSQWFPGLPCKEFQYLAWPYFEPGGEAKFEPRFRYAFKPPSGTSFLFLVSPYIHDSILPNLEIRCEAGCPSSDPLVLDGERGWYAIPIVPDTTVELVTVLRNIKWLAAPFPSPQITAGLVTELPDPINRDQITHWVAPLDTDTAERLPLLPILDLAAPTPEIQTLGQKESRAFGVLSYAASLDRSVRPGGWLLDKQMSSVPDSAARALVRVIQLSQIAQLTDESNYPESETENAPWKKRQKLLRLSLPLIMHRTGEYYRPHLEREILLTSTVIGSVARLSGDLDRSAAALNSLSREEKWQLLGRSAKTLNIESPKIIEDQNQLSAALIGAASEARHLLIELKNQQTLACLTLTRMRFSGGGVFPGVDVEEAVLNICEAIDE